MLSAGFGYYRWRAPYGTVVSAFIYSCSRNADPQRVFFLLFAFAAPASLLRFRTHYVYDSLSTCTKNEEKKRKAKIKRAV